MKSEAETAKSRDEKVDYSEKSTAKVYLVLWYSQIDESLNTIKLRVMDLSLNVWETGWASDLWASICAS